MKKGRCQSRDPRTGRQCVRHASHYANGKHMSNDYPPRIEWPMKRQEMDSRRNTHEGKKQRVAVCTCGHARESHINLQYGCTEKGCLCACYMQALRHERDGVIHDAGVEGLAQALDNDARKRNVREAARRAKQTKVKQTALCKDCCAECGHVRAKHIVGRGGCVQKTCSLSDRYDPTCGKSCFCPCKRFVEPVSAPGSEKVEHGYRSDRTRLSGFYWPLSDAFLHHLMPRCQIGPLETRCSKPATKACYLKLGDYGMVVLVCNTHARGLWKQEQQGGG